jgi:hypothetical protein
VTVDVSNTGPVVGSEVVFLHLSSVTDPDPNFSELKRFRRLDDLAVGSTTTVRFSLFPEDFRYFKPQSAPPVTTFIIKMGPLTSRIDLDLSSIDGLDNITLIDPIDFVQGEILGVMSAPPSDPPQAASPVSSPFSEPPYSSPVEKSIPPEGQAPQAQTEAPRSKPEPPPTLNSVPQQASPFSSAEILKPMIYVIFLNIFMVCF